MADEIQPNTLLGKIIEAEREREQAEFVPSLLLQTLLEVLNQREQEVITRRHGLLGKKKETLEAIGTSFHVTRERIRQIENTALRHVHASEEYRQVAGRMEQAIGRILDFYGGVMEERHLLSEALAHIPEQSREEPYVLFFLRAVGSDRVHEVVENEHVKTGWRLAHADVSFPHTHIQELKSIFTETEAPLDFDDVLGALRSRQFYTEHQHALNDDVIHAHLHLGKHFSQNPFEQWGLVSWKTITPKRMGDKIFLVLKKQTEPLHYREITEKINEYGFDHKKAHAPTVHNELILDDRYVLVGRGIYALKDWGFEPGIVADVIDHVLDEAGRPLTREEIIQNVLARRLVKRGTIYLALSDKKRFTRTPDGTYWKSI